MGLDDDDIAIGDYPRVCEELENALAEIEQLKAALSEARWIARTPGPATKAMIEACKSASMDDYGGCRLSDYDEVLAFLAEWPTPDPPPR